MFKQILKVVSASLLTAVLGVSCATLIQDRTAIQIDSKELVPYNFNTTNGNNRYKGTIRLNKRGNFFCSGVVIDGTYALTAAHCVVTGLGHLDQELIDISDTNDIDTGIKAKPVAIDRYKDIALIKGDFKDFQSTAPNFNGNNLSILMGKKVMACGYPAGGMLFCSVMILTGNYNFQFMAYGGYLYKGMSGGPVFDIDTGEVIGVNSAVYEKATLISPTLGVNSTWGI